MAGDLLDRLRPRRDGRKVGEDERDWAVPPAEDSWRSRRGGPARALAWVGVGAGYLLLVLPGVLARRDYRSWRSGAQPAARLAWALGVLALWALIVAACSLTPAFGSLLTLAVLLLPAALYPVVRT